MSIATKSGDTGQTGLFDGSRVPKTNPRIEAVGALDELNAWMGLCGGLHDLQCAIFELGALVANPKTEADFLTELTHLQQEFDALEAKLPKLTNFILPGGTERASRLHVARTVCRRAERAMAQVENLPEGCFPYINRLSDHLFLLARYDNINSDTEESIWTSS